MHAPPPENFNDSIAVRAWLEDQPQAVGVAIAARAALRVLPLAIRAEPSLRARFRPALMLPQFRATAAAWVASWRAGRESELFGAAEAAAHAAAYARAASAATAAYAARAASDASGANAAQFTANAVASAADARCASAACALDALIAHEGVSGESLSRRALWLRGAPDWAPADFARLRDHLSGAREGWEVWTDWYQARLDGAAFDPELETQRVLIPAHLWDEGPKAVNAEIARLIEARRSRRAREAEGEAAGASEQGDQLAKHIARAAANPALATAYGDIRIDLAVATADLAPAPSDAPAPVDPVPAADWRDGVAALGAMATQILRNITKHDPKNVGEALKSNLRLYARHARVAPDAINPRTLERFADLLRNAAANEDTRHALDEFAPDLDSLLRAHDDLMREYRADRRARLAQDRAATTLPPEATPEAVAEVVAEVAAAAREGDTGRLTLGPALTDVLQADSDAFKATLAAADITCDAETRERLRASLKLDSVAPLATIASLGLAAAAAYSIGAPMLGNVGSAASIIALVDQVLGGRIARAVQKALSFLGESVS